MTDRQHTPHTEAEINGVTRYDINGIRAYRIPVEGIPNHITNVYLVLDGKEASLIDVGFNSEKARADLIDGFTTISDYFKEDIELDDVHNIVITHGHDDHFGMLGFERLKGRIVYMSGLDSAMITDYIREDQKWRVCCQELVHEAGCSVDLGSLWPYEEFQVQPGDYNIVEVADGQQVVNEYQVFGTPGHSPGHICIGIGSMLFLGDHVLSLTTPHQSPRSGWRGVGLEIYLDSLKKVANLGMALGLPSHEDTIYSIKDRAEGIERFHRKRLDELVDLCRQERSLYQLTDDYYRQHPELIQASSIDRLGTDDFLLALEEIKAHVEFLVDKSRLVSISDNNGIVKYKSP